ncbi:hypothetical protein [Pseudomonas sp. SST3]|uniref:hypothetical protein n=1 Tax=Pseudomonas sp. SST3 TaxID=2267882 RepID=UPI001443A48F|nr:hypothetical protein [Pseudomonas sp. SST3]NKQ10831.1 hypothetical protein [Pseudomonas sp. SST3]
MSSRTDELSSRNYPIQEDMVLQSRMWKTERIGWTILIGIILITFTGVFSTGPLSRVIAQTAAGDIQVQYQRFERHGASTEIKINTRAGKDGQVWLTLDGDMLESFTIESIQPEPISSESFGRGLRLRFQSGPEGRTTAYFSLRPSGLGLTESAVHADGEHIAFTQFIYP